jgi:hypothetical protein
MDELKAEENHKRELSYEYEVIAYLQLRIRFNEEKVEGWKRDIKNWTKFIAEQRIELRPPGSIGEAQEAGEDTAGPQLNPMGPQTRRPPLRASSIS